ncbi:transcriptional regulator [Paenibacillus peoriae]|uniref:helix-turn-helix domain-containing protein n=1 Tax=Paenibacillus peoriae TaxID=59893 RepID=UPI000CECE0C5|nr:helix-turn-helix transcriptional regulator [Paenibacillus peoriae]PPQ47521.1 transcriptional regulator [Paenibacillus peoriae]
MTDLAELIGVRIRQVRKSRGLTQEQLGERAQLQSTYIGGVERGERNISIETLEKLIKALEMSPSEFFYFGDNPIEKDTDKNKLIHIFISKLMEQENKNIRKMINIYREIFE